VIADIPHFYGGHQLSRLFQSLSQIDFHGRWREHRPAK